MSTELTFLIELLLKHKLPLATKELIASRIKDVESNYSSVHPVGNPNPRPPANNPTGVVQAASTQAILDRNPDLLSAAATIVPLEAIGQTPAAQAAMADRAAIIRQSMSREPRKGESSPVKMHGTLHK